MDEVPVEALQEGAWREVAAIDAALARGDLDEVGWHAAMQALVVPAYLAAGTPWGQSGAGGDATRWAAKRRILLQAVDSGGDFLDVGCANGYLLLWVTAVSRWGRPFGSGCLSDRRWSGASGWVVAAARWSSSVSW